MSRTVPMIARAARRRLSDAWLFSGTGVECPFCGWTGRSFAPGGLDRRPKRKCPRCGSLERYRMLLLYLLERSDVFWRSAVSLLDVAPTPYFRRFVDSYPQVSYVGTDLTPVGPGVVSTDLTRAGFRSASFDLILCFHVLEHVPDDIAAMAELRRCLRRDGELVIQVPLREGLPTEEDLEAPPEERLRRFGKDDHVRYYGDDVVDRLVSVGFEVSKNKPREWLGEPRFDKHGLKGDDQILLICR